jgi:hypothetical protein
MHSSPNHNLICTFTTWPTVSKGVSYDWSQQRSHCERKYQHEGRRSLMLLLLDLTWLPACCLHLLFIGRETFRFTVRLFIKLAKRPWWRVINTNITQCCKDRKKTALQLHNLRFPTYSQAHYQNRITPLLFPSHSANFAVLHFSK